MKQILLSKLSTLTTQISMCEDICALSAVEKYLTSGACNTVFPCQISIPNKQVRLNKNISPQRPFLSTKKKSARKATLKQLLS